MADNSLTETLEQLRRGDPDAFLSLYEATVRMVFALALRITANRADAEEVTNDVYAQLWRTASRFDPSRGGVLQWIAVIARSRALDHLRRRAQNGSVNPADRQVAYLPESAPTADDVLQSFERGTLVRAALSSLSSLQVQLIGLAFFEGLSHREIAARIRLPLGTVKSHIRRALLALREALVSADAPAPRSPESSVAREIPRPNQRSR